MYHRKIQLFLLPDKQIISGMSQSTREHDKYLISSFVWFFIVDCKILNYHKNPGEKIKFRFHAIWTFFAVPYTIVLMNTKLFKELFLHRMFIQGQNVANFSIIQHNTESIFLLCRFSDHLTFLSLLQWRKLSGKQPPSWISVWTSFF